MVGAAVPLEVARTVLEFADFTWTAMECSHHLHHNPEHHKQPMPEKGSPDSSPEKSKEEEEEEQELEALRSENRRLRNLLEQNLKLLDSIAQSPISQSCPPDLQERIISAVNSKSFVDKLESYSGRSCGEFPFSEASAAEDLEKADILVNLDQKDPSWWVWVSDETTPINFEAPSEIDSENYVIVTEEHVVDGIANFMAKCIASNPKAKVLPPQQLQKALTKALEGESKLETVVYLWTAGRMFYTISTWGFALAGLYSARSLLKVAATGVHHSSKLVMKAL